MKRYFFNVRYRDGFILDEEGSIYTSLEAAWSGAVTALRELIAADVQIGNLDLDQSISIIDDTGILIGEVGFGAVLNIIGSGSFVLHSRDSSVDVSLFPPMNAVMISSIDGVTLSSDNNAAH